MLRKTRKAKRKAPATPTWQNRKKTLQVLIEEAFQDDVIREVRDQVLALLQQAPLTVGPVDGQGRLDLASLTEEHIANTYYRSPHLVRWYFEFVEHRQRLLELARQYNPRLRDFPAEEIEDFLTLTLLPVPEPWLRAATYLAPNTPARVLPTGDLLIPKGSRLDKYQAWELRDFVNAENPGKLGRPLKLRDTPTRTPKAPDKKRAEMAALAFRNHENNLPWIVTAKEVCPDLVRKGNLEAARKRVARLRYLGEKLDRQKTLKLEAFTTKKSRTHKSTP